MPERGDVQAAAERLAGRVLETPVFVRQSLSRRVGCEVHFKCEIFQRTGSFKYRGASNAVMQLEPAARKQGVVTHSSGNHGAALALAAREAGMRARIVVPRAATPLKRQAILAYGAEIVDCGDTLAEREAVLAEVMEETGAVFVPPYDHAHVIAGQGTAAAELLAAVPGLEEIWVPVGGGGLASGTLIAAAGSGVKVWGVEPELADDAYWSLQRGCLQPQRPPETIADGLRTALGELPFAVFQALDLKICTVPESAILAGQRLLWERMKLVVEPSAAVPLAGLMAAVAADPEGYAGRRVGIILSGGNAAFPFRAS